MSRDQSRLLSFVAVVVLAAATFVALRPGAQREELAPVEGHSAHALSQAPPAAASRAELEALAAEVRALRTELELLQHVPRSAARQADTMRATEPLERARSDAASALGPAEALALYVRSFDHGGEGLELYRLVVQAHAPELVALLLPHVTSQRSQVLLRLRLTEILGDTRLQGDTRVLAALAALLVEELDARVPLASAASIVRLTSAHDAPWVEARWAQSSRMDVRVTLLDHLVRLAGEDPNPCLVRLLAAAPDEAARALVVARLAPHAAETALPAFELVQGLEQPVRLAAAQRVAEFRSEGFHTLVRAWREREPDEAVRRALGEAAEALAAVPPYHPEQACGAPDVTTLGADVPEAWASAAADGGVEWLEVEFTTPVRADLVRVHETCSPGALQEIILVLDDGSREGVWKGTRSRQTPGPFDVPIQPARPVRAVRVVLDTARVTGWNEIDAIELVGPGGTTHADRARASSYYGQGRRSSFARGEAVDLIRTLQLSGR